MQQTVKLPNGREMVMPDLPPHHHVGKCACTPAVGYIRVSDVHGRGPDQFVSPELQLDSIITWCTHQNRRLIKLIFDIDKTGQTFEGRVESVSEILDGCRNGSWSTVAMWKWSRWSRDTTEALAWVKKVEQAGGEVRACTEDVDPRQAKAKLIRGFHLLLAEDRGDEIGEGWKAAHKNRRRNGLPHTGRPRFGYEYRLAVEADIAKWPDYVSTNDVGKRRYLPDPATSTLLLDAYRRYNTGDSLRSIVRDWNASGIRTTRDLRWTPQALGKMLDTGFAAGYIRYRTNPPKKAPANRMASYDGWDKGSQPLLITEKVWVKYKSRREGQAQLPPRSRSAVHSVSALLFCGCCGLRQSTKYQGRSRTHQWTCQARTAKHPDVHVGISNELILGYLRDWITGRAPSNFAERVSAQAARLSQQKKAVLDLGRIRTELEQIEKTAIPNLIRLQIRNAITEEHFDMMKAEEEEKARVLREDLRVAEALEAESTGKLDIVVNDLAENWDLYRTDPPSHRELLGTVIAGVLISPGKGKLDLSSRVQVFPAWEEADFKLRVEALRAAASQ